MNFVIALDAGPLSLLAHRKDHHEAQACRTWLASHIASGAQMIVPAIADYEVRRELLRAGKTTAVGRLDEFVHMTAGRFLAPTSEAFQKAAELWAKVRNERLQTASDESLDADVILAGQLLTSRFANQTIVVATTNPKHISRFLNAKIWQQI